jgi:hypothetical protein
MPNEVSSDGVLMPLSVALKVCFPYGGVKKTTMLAAIRSGKLECSKVDKAYMVTEADIQNWIEKCRIPAKM